MALNADLLRESFALVLERNDRVTARFYEVLFAKYPHLKPMFGRNSREAQEKMLASALVAVMDHLDDAAWLGATLGGLGAKHDAYGVTPEMYDMVGDALLTTLAEIAGDEWTPDVRDAWIEAYGAIVSLMTTARSAAA
jgi:hemoglobin-like flavoprotein